MTKLAPPIPREDIIDMPDGREVVVTGNLRDAIDLACFVFVREAGHIVPLPKWESVSGRHRRKIRESLVRIRDILKEVDAELEKGLKAPPKPAEKIEPKKGL